jgi:predicted acylesterase/phospholipase RssA
MSERGLRVVVPPSRRATAHVASRVTALAALLAVVAPTVARAEDADADAPAGRPEDAVTLTVSGGVSLGAYEAGLAWGIIQFLKAARADGGHTFLRPRLAAVAGASAGAVNGFLAAALWCERRDHAGSVDSNLLLDAWLDLDFDELLPRSADGYAHDDGLLAAAPLERTRHEIRENLFGSRAAGRFSPGCRVPVGISVTPFEPRQRDVAGLTTSTQRLVIPWQLEVGADGAVMVRRQPLPRSELAESVLDLAGIPGQAEATPFRPEVVEQALLASAAFPVGFAPRRLCEATPAGEESCDDYVDGGVFDNAPMGLAVALVEASGGGTVLHPVISFLVDPERRRLAPGPARPEQVEDEHPTLGRQLRLFGNLLTTARSAELARAIRSRGWNRTTQRLLREFSTVSAEVAEVHATLAGLTSPQESASGAGGRKEVPVGRAAFGRALSACLDRLTAAADRASSDPCARDVLSMRVESPAPGDEPLPPREVARLAERLAGLFRAAQERLASPPTSAEIVARRDSLQAGAAVVAAALLFLADEVGRVAASGLQEGELRAFRDAVLDPIRRSAGLIWPTNVLIDALLARELERLAQRAPPTVAAEARRARDRLARLPQGALFALDVLDGAATATTEALRQGAWEPADSVEAWRGVLHVVQARIHFAELSPRVAALGQRAQELGGRSASEQRLSVSTRFAPLAGAQLSGFAGFLDRPLRRYDYYAGVYEAVHAVAVARCTDDPPLSGDAVPARLPDDPNEIDLTATASQRCVGELMKRGVDALGLRASPRGGHVVATLAGLELAAWLGGSSRAQLLRREPSWAWLDDFSTPSAGDPVLVTLHALTAAKVPCRPGDDEPLCPSELSFDGFLEALRAHGYRPSSDGLELALRDPTLFWADTLARLADRSLAVERRAVEAGRAVGAEPSPLSGAVMVALSAGELLARRVAERGPTPKLLLDPSTIPNASLDGQSGWRRVVAHALPYRLSLDVSRGGFSLAWLEPELRLRRWLTLRSTLEPVGYRGGHGWTSAAGALLVGHAGSLSLGAGPRWWIDWSGGSGLGVEARVAALQDRLALGVGVRDPGASPGDRGWFVTLSVADLNGLVFWLTPLGGAR